MATKTTSQAMATVAKTTTKNTKSNVIADTASASFLQAKVAEQQGFIDEISKLVNALDSNIDWDNQKPVSKIRRFGFFLTHNWEDIFNIIMAIVKLVNSRK